MRIIPVVETLRCLIDTCSDAAHRFQACRHHATDPRLRSKLDECRDQRTLWSEQLQALLGQFRCVAHLPKRSSLPLHAGWISVRCAFSPQHPDRLVIDECRRGEHITMARYHDSLKGPEAHRIAPLIRKQLICMRKDDRHLAALALNAARHQRASP